MAEEIIFDKPRTIYTETHEYCHRFKYKDKEVDDKHNEFMDSLHWVDTGSIRFNSGNGELRIWKRWVSSKYRD